MENARRVRILCRKLILTKNEPSLQWLIGSPFFSPLTITSTFKCLHTLLPNPFSPNFPRESDDLRSLLLRGFHLIGALIVTDDANSERLAVDAARRMREVLYGGEFGGGGGDLIGAVADLGGDGARFFVARFGDLSRIECVSSVVYEDEPEKYVWDTGCLIRCELAVKLPFCYPVNSSSDAEKIFLRATEALAARFKDPRVVYMVEKTKQSQNTEASSRPIIVRGVDLDFHTHLSNVKLVDTIAVESNVNSIPCSYFCSKSKPGLSFSSVENADTIQVSVLINKSESSPKSVAPIAEYFLALDEARLLFIDYKLEVLCYAAKGLPVTYAVSELIIPGLMDQLNAMKNAIMPNLLTQHPQLRPYHFSPPGILHPITVLYELSYGETEIMQVEVRRSLHLRLGLPLDRPLIRTVSALFFSETKGGSRRESVRKGSPLLKDVHIGIPTSGVSGGLVSLVQGSYDYHHYLQDGIDDSGWGCAYRSLQTIISWFRLQHYTSVNVPSHREIQQSLVDIGDKDPSFIGSREWIGAIELSFVLDKLLGVTCKIMNVRSGAELPEKCRELALHFETQGTPIMIGGGVLAYTLLGVDYNETSGDCAFLILDPHYTGSDEEKKVVNGGWCGWKKAVDNKGKNFFLHDKFYNLLLPQRPNMV